MNPLRWLLVPPAWQALKKRYDLAQMHGASSLASWLQDRKSVV